jgi:hypothetical protein
MAVTTTSLLLSPSSISAASCSITTTGGSSCTAPKSLLTTTQLHRRASSPLERTFAAHRRDFFPSEKLQQQRRKMAQGARALFGNKDSSDGKEEDKKFITKEQEPEQYWQTAAEKEGKNPMQSVLPYIAIVGLLTPFAILALAFANNWIKLPR